MTLPDSGFCRGQSLLVILLYNVFKYISLFAFTGSHIAGFTIGETVGTEIIRAAAHTCISRAAADVLGKTGSNVLTIIILAVRMSIDTVAVFSADTISFAVFVFISHGTDAVIGAFFGKTCVCINISSLLYAFKISGT